MRAKTVDLSMDGANNKKSLKLKRAVFLLLICLTGATVYAVASPFMAQITGGATAGY